MFRVLIHVSLSSADIVINNGRVLLNKPCTITFRTEPSSRSSGGARVHCCCVTGDRSLYCTVLRVHIVDNVVDADTNTIYYTFIIIRYTVHISLFSCISPLHTLRSPSPPLSPHFRGFHSVPLQPIRSCYDRKPRPAPGTRRRRAPLPF